MLSIEIWKPIRDKEGKKTKYQVSSTGFVRRKKSRRILKASPNTWGYYQVTINIDGKIRSKSVHRLVALAFIKNPDPEKFTEVNHINGDKSDNSIDNLEWIDRSGNMKHAFDSGLKDPMVGEDNPLHIYNDEQIHEICRLLQEGHSNSYIKKVTGIPKYIINDVKHRRTWKHISCQYDVDSFISKNDFSQYWETIDHFILRGYTTKYIIAYFKANFELTDRQIRNLLHTRRSSLKRQGKLN